MSSLSLFRTRSFGFGLILFVVVSALYLATLSPTLGYGDSGELIAAARRLGVNHPPSNPVYLLLVRLFSTLLPFLPFARAVNLFSALAGVAAVLLFYSGCLKVLRLTPGRSLLAAGALALNGTFWGQAVVAEVYLLTSLLMMVVFFALLSDRSHRWAEPGLFLLAGVGMGIHYSAAVLLPSLLWFLAPSRGSRRGSAGPAALLLFLLGASVMSYVYFRAGKVENVDYGHIRTFSDFIRHISWRQYEFRPDTPRTLGLLAGQFSWILLVLLKEVHLLLLPAAAGALGLVKKGRFPLLLFGPLMAFALTWLFNYPSLEITSLLGPPKMLPLVVWIYFLAAVGMAAARRRSLLPWIVGAAMMVNLLLAWPSVNRSSNRVYHAWGESLLKEAGGGPAALFIEGDIEIMPLLYLTEVEGRGENLTIVDRGGSYFRDIYRYEDYPPQLRNLVREKAEKEFAGKFPGKVFFTKYPGHFDGSRVVPRGLLFEVVQRGKPAGGGAPLPVMPQELEMWLEAPEGLEYRERDIISRFIARGVVFETGEEQREEALRLAAALSPDNPIHLTGLARYLSSRGEKEEAGEYFARAYGIAWMYEPAIAGHVQSLVDAGDLAGAIAVTERFHLLDRGNPFTLRNLARLRRAAGDDFEAVRLEEEAEGLLAEWRNLRERYFP